MAAQKSEETIVFLPWTVEPQPQTQAVILQQPSETHLRLDATTDKTAISSFALSVIIALILGGLATWLAYWYGRKSFDLTKQSFDTVIKQIDLSKSQSQNDKDILIKEIQSATEATYNSHQSLINSQTHLKIQEIQANTDLKKLEIKVQLKFEHFNILRKELGLVIIILEEYQQDIYEISHKFFQDYGSRQSMQNINDEKYIKATEKLREKRFYINKSKEKLLLLLDDKTHEHQMIKELIKHTAEPMNNLFLKCLQNNEIKENDKKILDEIINDLRIKSNNLLVSEYNNLFELYSSDKKAA